jgi:hypothetical protein
VTDQIYKLQRPKQKISILLFGCLDEVCLQPKNRWHEQRDKKFWNEIYTRRKNGNKV